METDQNNPSDIAADKGNNNPSGALVEALEGLFGACQLTNLYPPGHPSVPKTAQAAAKEFDKVLADRESIVVGVTHDRLMFDSQNICDTSKTLDHLAHLLHELDVAAIEFSAGIVAKELEACAQELTTAFKQQLKGEKLADTIKEKTIDHIKLYPIDYGAVNFADGAEKRHSDETPTAGIWKQMIRSLTDPTAGLEGEHIQQLAHDVAGEIERHEGMGVDLLRQQIHGVVQDMQAMPTEQQKASSGRLAQFVTALQPGLRDDLLHVDGENPGPSLSVMAGLADEIPMEELVGALQQVNTQCGRAPKELLFLVNKLVLIAQQQPETSKGLQDTLSRWGVPSQADHEDSVDLQASLEEMFQFRSQTKFNPETYRSQLDQISSANLAKMAQIPMLKYRSMLDDTVVRLENVEITAQLLELTDGDQYCAGLLGYASDQTDLLLEHKRFKLLYELVQAAQRNSDQEDCSEETRLATTGYLNDWKNPKRIGSILKIISESDRVSEEVLGLLHLGKPVALHCVLDMIDSVRSPQAVQSLRLWVRDSGIDELSQLITDRSDGGWETLKPVFPILGQMPGRETESILIPLSRHKDPRARGEALRVLCQSTDLSQSAHQQIYRALCDNNERTQASAIYRLGRQKKPESIEVLGAYIERALPDQPAVTFHCPQAVRILEGWGEEGLDRLCGALRTLSISLQPQNAPSARTVAQALQSKRDVPGVNLAWQLWRFSPIRLVGFFSERRRHAKGGRS